MLEYETGLAITAPSGTSVTASAFYVFANAMAGEILMSFVWQVCLCSLFLPCL